MIQTVTFQDFRDAFRKMERDEQFSYDGLKAIYDYCEETDPTIELDVIAICCDFTEYKNFEELQGDYEIKTLTELQNKTVVLELENGGIVIQNF